MKRILSALISLWFCCSSLQAQRNDNVWVMGYHYWPYYIAALDFYYGSPDTVGLPAQLDMFLGNASICNDAGELQFFTNGEQVENRFFQPMDNSTDFNQDPSTSAYGLTDLNFPQCVLAIPYPGSPDHYVIFHLPYVIWNNGNNGNPMQLKYSVVDMSANGGVGRMTQKARVFYDDTLLYNSMQAVRHGNGRDWWIINRKCFSNELIASLFTSDGPGILVHSGTGPAFGETYSNGQSVFSPDGNWFASTRTDSNQLILYAFDRCLGQMTYRETIHFPADPLGNVTGCSFSPDGSKLYASTPGTLYQFNMGSARVDSTRRLIAVFDGFSDPFPGYFFRHRLGPDNRIYIQPYSSSRFLGIIADPDQPDSACHFIPHGLQMKSWSASLPEFPNYRLFNIPGSLCDSIMSAGVVSEEDTRLTIYPNPVIDELTIQSVPVQDGFVEITNAAGDAVLKQFRVRGENKFSFRTDRLKPGLYIVHIHAGHYDTRGKFVKMN